MIGTCLELLRRWQPAADRYWYAIPGQPGLGCYGTGYNSWGVQTNQKYLAAMAALAALGPETIGLTADEADQARDRALAALRFSLWSHVSGDGVCTDGSRWGHTWISGLGIERMMYGVELLNPWLTAADRAAVRRVLTSEAGWICEHHQRGGHAGVVGDVDNSSGRNNPESNLWNGALLWRAAVSWPDEPQAAAWREQAHRFLMNSVSVATDAEDDRVVAGKAVRDWHVGANFHPNYALDHHGYANVGYQVICLSNAAMLHFDLRAQGLAAPESLYHHNRDLWQAIRRHVFADGRLARIGGDSRVRYTYCQEYLLPSLVYAADWLGDADANHLVAEQLKLIGIEAETNADGSFYGSRLGYLIGQSTYYYTRLESDRACVLGMTAAYLRLAKPGAQRDTGFEASVTGGWSEPGYGAVSHRCPTRFASFTWPAHGLTNGLCLPPGESHLAEWDVNLAGRIVCQGDDGLVPGGQTNRRRVERQAIASFEGGFLTWGAVTEGMNLFVAEGWQGTDSALHQLAWCALPDGHTVVCLQHCRAASRRLYTLEVIGINLLIPNDLYNDCERQLSTAQDVLTVVSPAAEEECQALVSRWCCVDGQLGVAGIYGADSLSLRRSPARRGGKYRSLYVDTIGFPLLAGSRAWESGEVILDAGWLVMASADVSATRQASTNAGALDLAGIAAELRGVDVVGADGRHYALLANFSESDLRVPRGTLSDGMTALVGEVDGDAIPLAAGGAALFVVPS